MWERAMRRPRMLVAGSWSLDNAFDVQCFSVKQPFWNFATGGLNSPLEKFVDELQFLPWDKRQFDAANLPSVNQPDKFWEYMYHSKGIWVSDAWTETSECCLVKTP